MQIDIKRGSWLHRYANFCDISDRKIEKGYVDSCQLIRKLMLGLVGLSLVGFTGIYTLVSFADVLAWLIVGFTYKFVDTHDIATVAILITFLATVLGILYLINKAIVSTPKPSAAVQLYASFKSKYCTKITLKD